MKDLFDKLVYKRVVDNFIDQIQYHFFTGNVPLKRNEALLFCWDIIPKNYEPNILEVNTNTAVDDDLVEWFDFNPIVSALERWQYDNVIVLVEDGEYDNILEGKWYQSLQATCSKINKKVSLRPHMKEVLFADFKARGAGKMELEERYDELMRIFGYKW